MKNIPKKHFYMIRHGKTISNVEGYVAGSLDVLLVDEGREEARKMRRVVDTLAHKPKLMVHSNLSRAKDTAIILNENQHLPMLEKALMAERNLGDWAGIPMKTWYERRAAGLVPPNGESTEVFEQRVMSGLEDILRLPEEPVLIVTHGGVIRA